MTIKTRFAPSPTGYLHLGGARTALFCALFAQANKGSFVLRIEDTDRERSTEESVQAIFDGMNWLGLQHDEGPYFQTKRFDRYREVVQQLLDGGHAYHCYCTPEELNTMREEATARKEKPRYNGFWRDRTDSPPPGVAPVVRFKNPLDGDVVIDDAVKGTITISNTELDDLIIMRSDGSPTYNLTVVVDDMDMGITHVIRGDDHVNNTPRQINLFKALGAELPVFAHLPMILGPDGKRMSKRHGAVSVMQYQQDGYLPEAMLNYLVRLGWSHQDQELFEWEDMVKLFSLDGVNRAGAVFDRQKLNWVNQQHMQKMSGNRLAERVLPYLDNSAGQPESGRLAAIAELLASRSETLVELAEQMSWFFTAPSAYDEKAAAKQFKPSAAVVLRSAGDHLAKLSNWESDAIDACLQQVVAEQEIGFGKLGLPLRLALTGDTKTPELGKTLELMDQSDVVARIERAVSYIENLQD